MHLLTGNVGSYLVVFGTGYRDIVGTLWGPRRHGDIMGDIIGTAWGVQGDIIGTAGDIIGTL